MAHAAHVVVSRAPDTVSADIAIMYCNRQSGEEFGSHGLTPLACFASKLILKTINPLGTIRWEGNRSNARIQHSTDRYWDTPVSRAEFEPVIPALNWPRIRLGVRTRDRRDWSSEILLKTLCFQQHCILQNNSVLTFHNSRYSTWNGRIKQRFPAHT